MDILDIAIAKQLAGGGSGGGQPLYRHTVRVYEDSDTYEIFLQLVSTSSEVVDSEDKLKALLGTGVLPCICSGKYTPNGGEIYIDAHVIIYRDGKYWIHHGEDLTTLDTQDRLDMFSTDYYLHINDTVTEIGTASVSGGGDCQIVELPSMGHASIQTTIIEMLKPDSVPTGKYLYSYYIDSEDCRNGGTIAICFKNDTKITGAQITSDGEVRKFWYDFESEEESNVCFQPLGGKPLYRHDIRFAGLNDEYFIRFTLLSRDITSYDTLSAIRNVMPSKWIPASGAIYIEDEKHIVNSIIFDSKNFTIGYDCDLEKTINNTGVTINIQDEVTLIQ